MPYTIMLDAGHGGRDPGAVFNGRQEKDDTLRLTLAIGEILQNNGVDVEYTRTVSYTHLDVYKRQDMQRILNNPDDIVDEMLKGFLKAHADVAEATGNPRVVKAKNIPEGKVGVVTGGGSGHKPAFIGDVGKNLCDAAAVGEICSSPTAAAFLDAFREADQGKGVACLYGNYSGDNMNVKMAVRMAKKEGITVKTVVANLSLIHI